jgi:hypothetical protein
MDTAQLIVNVLGFGILGWVIYGMKQRLNTQASILDEQNKMFEGAKVFLDFANPKNLKEVAEDIVALKEERMKEEMEKDMRKLNAKLEETSDRSQKTTEILMMELKAAARLASGLLYYVPPNHREAAIEGTPKSWIKDVISEDIENRPYWRPVLNYAALASGLEISAADPLLRAKREAAIQKATRQE